jgi:hypothetical protein
MLLGNKKETKVIFLLSPNTKIRATIRQCRTMTPVSCAGYVFKEFRIFLMTH